MGNFHRIEDRERKLRRYAAGEHRTGELSFPDEDRRFEGRDLCPCPVCGLYPTVQKARFGQANRYRVICDREWHRQDNPQETLWLSTRTQAARVWRMNCLLNGAKA